MNFGILIILCITIIVSRTVLGVGQQEEKFFYHADFTDESDHHPVAESVHQFPVFPEGPLHVSLGLRALSGDNRPQYSEAIANSQPQVELLKAVIVE